MRFVKIGDTYFNPMRITLVTTNDYLITTQRIPGVEVWTDGHKFGVEGKDLGLDIQECTELWEAQGIADAMMAKVVAMVNEALK